MAKPFFTIIIPSLNEEKYLPVLLQDLSQQSWSGFEIILVDAHSEDKTISQAKKFQSKLALTIINSQQRNVSYQRNLGAKNAQADNLVFMDADNQLPKYFMLGLRYRLERHRPDLFTCYLMADTNKAADRLSASVMNFGVELSSNLEELKFAMGALIGCQTEIFKTIKGFDTSLSWGEDGDFIRRAVKAGFDYQIFKDPKFVYSFRRVRKEGTLKALHNSTKLTHQLISQQPFKTLDKDYPMLGGSLYNEKVVIKKPVNKKLQRLYQQIKELFS